MDQSNHHIQYGGIQTKPSQLHYMKDEYGFSSLGVRFAVFPLVNLFQLDCFFL